jgi:tripartite-type tricarboxylate transporter receptor subunit TctC
MRTNIRGALLSIVTAGVIGVSGSAGYAQSFPSRPVKLVTDVGTGGTYDIFARVLGEELQKRWGVGVIVEPHPGGNGIIGTRVCAEAPPDGNTLCILSSQGLVMNEFLAKVVLH